MNKCLRCNHEWRGRTDARAVQCPKCKSPRWDKPLVRTQMTVRGQVAAAIRRGELARLDGSIKCVDCGLPAKQYDHRDYNKPLEVEPVCKRCNKKRGPAANYVRDTVVQVAVRIETEKIILMLAKAEKRSKSNMISVLIGEALAYRQNKSDATT